MLNVNVKNQIQELELVEAVRKYVGQTIYITSIIKGEDFSSRVQIMEDIEITVLNKGMCFEDKNKNRFEVAFDKMKDTYISVMNIFIDEEPEINIMFNYGDTQYSIINLV